MKLRAVWLWFLGGIVASGGCGYVGVDLIGTAPTDEKGQIPDADSNDQPTEPQGAGDLTDDRSGQVCELGTQDHCGACNVSCQLSDYNEAAGVVCEENQCVLSTCTPGFGDCDGASDNGCETSLRTPEHCGTCDVACQTENAGTRCDQGKCAIAECDEGFADCDGLYENGCEQSLTSLGHCGACDTRCEAARGTTECSGGRCVLSACRAGFGNCDDDDGNGCETDLSTESDCGACGKACTVTDGTASCVGGVCTAANCTPPFADCDGDSESCESDLTSLEHCGACGAPCGDGGRLDHATASCTSGRCAVGACDTGYDDCDGTPDNGCETDLSTTTDCGGCGVRCLAANAVPICTDGSCSIDRCLSGHADCNGNPGDGCEANLETGLDCGACGRRCGAGEFCQDSACVPFNLAASNLDVQALPLGGAPTTRFDCGTTRFDSSALAFNNTCGEPLPQAVVVSQTDGPDIVVLPFRQFSLSPGATLRVIGNRPVAIVSATDTLIDGVLDVSAAGTTPGAGGDLSCGVSAGRDGSGTSTDGGGGGGGGGFGRSGVEGGYSGAQGNQGSGGQNRGHDNLSPLLAGCHGGRGGGCSESGGAGAGSVQITSGGILTVSGSIRANGGAGGDGCGARGGARGGGSGGGVLLEAVVVRVTGTVQAHGGDGGQGAAGGAGGLGETGSRRASAGQNPDTGGGGGGGGAVGRIHVRASSTCSLAGTLSALTLTDCP